MLASIPTIGVGAAVGSLLTFIVLHLQPPSSSRVRGGEHAPFYENTVMLNGDCKIMKQDNLTVANPNPEFPHVIATVVNPNYGLHVMVLGRDSKIYHKHQTSLGEKGNWTDWKCLTPDLTKVPCSMAPHCGGYDNQPVMAWQPVNGKIVAFVRQQNDLVPHEMHLTDPKDPDSWSQLRGPSCLCNFPPCKDKGQVNCGVVSECDNLGVDCTKHPDSDREYYEFGPLFPTSELQLMPEAPGSDKLAIFFRGFTGHYYSSSQVVAGDAGGKWGGVSGSKGYFGDKSVIE